MRKWMKWETERFIMKRDGVVMLMQGGEGLEWRGEWNAEELITKSDGVIVLQGGLGRGGGGGETAGTEL